MGRGWRRRGELAGAGGARGREWGGGERGEKVQRAGRARDGEVAPARRPPAPARSPCCSRSTPGTARSPGRRGPQPPRGRTSYPCRSRARAGAGAGARRAGARLVYAARSTVEGAGSGSSGAAPGAPGRRGAAVGVRGPGSRGRRTQRRGHASRGRAGGGPGDQPRRAPGRRCARAGRGDVGRGAGARGAARELRCAGRARLGRRRGCPLLLLLLRGGLSRGAAETRGPAPPLALPLLPPPPVPSPRRRRSAPPSAGSWRAARPAGALPARPAPPRRPCPARPSLSLPEAPVLPTAPPSLCGPLCPRGLGAPLAPSLRRSGRGQAPGPRRPPRPGSRPLWAPAPATRTHVLAAAFPPSARRLLSSARGGRSLAPFALLPA